MSARAAARPRNARRVHARPRGNARLCAGAAGAVRSASGAEGDGGEGGSGREETGWWAEERRLGGESAEAGGRGRRFSRPTWKIGRSDERLEGSFKVRKGESLWRDALKQSRRGL